MCLYIARYIMTHSNRSTGIRRYWYCVLLLVVIALWIIVALYYWREAKLKILCRKTITNRWIYFIVITFSGDKRDGKSYSTVSLFQPYIVVLPFRSKTPTKPTHITIINDICIGVFVFKTSIAIHFDEHHLSLYKRYTLCRYIYFECISRICTIDTSLLNQHFWNTLTYTIVHTVC